MKTNIDDVWGIHEAPRLPIEAVEWAMTPSRIELPRHLHREVFRSLVSQEFPERDQRLFTAFRKLLDARSADFKKAAQVIKPEAWRLLHYRGTFVAEALAEYRFHPNQSLQALCLTTDEFLDPPRSWLGTERNTEDIATELEAVLQEIGYGPSAAAWLTLAMVQRASLTKAEILRCSWWSPEWLRPFSERVLLSV